MKLSYWFRPAQHWNIVSKEVYDRLCWHYSSIDNRLKIVIEKE